MVEMMWLIMIGTSIWVGFDASSNKVTAGSGSYSAMNGAVGWVIVCLLVWIVAFPVYLIRRAKVLRKRVPVVSMPSSAPEQLL